MNQVEEISQDQADLDQNTYPQDKKDAIVEYAADNSEDSLNNEKDYVITFADLDSNEGIVTNVLDDINDPNESAWTFRTVLLGTGIGVFGSVLQEIYYFKPQGISVSGIFLLMIAYVFGEAMSHLIPRRGWLKYLNPHPFNAKEHAAIYIMASSASAGTLATEVLAVQRLWYNTSLNSAIGIFICFSSQLLGYGFVGILRSSLIFPSKMMYPNSLPMATTIQTLHRNPEKVKPKLKIFYITFAALFFWEILPEYMFLMLVGFSIPCLAAPNNPIVSRLFGGANGNEGLGILSLCFDWNYIGSPMVQPLVTTVNQLFGYFLCIGVFLGVYYGNVWDSQKFPFLSQELYNYDSEPGNYSLFNQTAILDASNSLNVTALEQQGIPYLTGTYVCYLIATNMALSATIVFMCLHHWEVMKFAFEWMKPSNLKETFQNAHWKFWEPRKFDSRLNADGTINPLHDDKHFRAMLKYKEVPQWWYTATVILSCVVALTCLYKADTHLAWWQFLISVALSFFLVLFLGGLNAIFGFQNNMQTTIQMIGGYIRPGNPLANMYFTLYGYNSVQQAFQMMGDLKTAQYVKLSPRSTFAAQFSGTVIGAIFNYIIMNQVVDNKREILLSIEGTTLWSGQAVQQYNTQGITWGALPKYMYSVGCRYQWVPLSFLLGFVIPIPFYFLARMYPKSRFIRNISVPILVSNIGWLVVGINSGITIVFIIAFTFQWYIRRYHPKIFADYNYLISAGMTGGTQVMVFLLSFAVAGAAGSNHPFPQWWGNRSEDANGNPLNVDHCLYVD
jgi:OPT family small oligopeptide transporter